MKLFLSVFLVCFLVACISAATTIKSQTSTVNCFFDADGGICRKKFKDNAIPVGIINSSINVTISDVINPDKTTVYICVTPSENMSPNNLQDNCPAGSLIEQSVSEVANKTTANIDVEKKSFLGGSRFIGTHFNTKALNQFAEFEQVLSDDSDEDYFLVPGSDFIVASLKDIMDEPSSMTIAIEYNYCTEQGVWDNVSGSCIETPGNLVNGNFTANANSWTYYTFNDQTDGAHSITFGLTTYGQESSGDSPKDKSSSSSSDFKNINLFLSDVTFPNGVNTGVYATINVEDNVMNYTIYCQGECGMWYLGVRNTNDDAYKLDLTHTKNSCKGNNFGENCAYIPANVTTLNINNSPNNTFDRSDNTQKIGYQVAGDDEVIMDYYKVKFNNNVPANGYLRITTASTKTKYNAPSILIRAGNYPTRDQYNYNVTSNDFVNQAIIPFNINEEYYVAVVGKNGNSYVIWGGANCANLCDHHSDNPCMCNGGNCTKNNVFAEVQTVNDSFGACDCKKKYELYDCSGEEDDSSFDSIYIVLIAIGGAIILAVAIGVPVYCYIQNRRRSKYERV
eukprot:TRINITY_DN661_c0_g1_i1.p1 TRINITY_DN661_c0_g1~~TRINITY_DN661_c0_g1_i1.p1  ORF type:complete len:565 (+),score=177.60 TRINITY_DN661_c0_g1_i1:106-1800(+)